MSLDLSSLEFESLSERQLLNVFGIYEVFLCVCVCVSVCFCVDYIRQSMNRA